VDVPEVASTLPDRRERPLAVVVGALEVAVLVDRLADDHRRAARFREALLGTPGLGFSTPSPTNLVYIDVPESFTFSMHLADRNILCLPEKPTQVRAAFNLHVTDDDVDSAVAAFKEVAALSEAAASQT